MKAVICLAGEGKRLRPLTDDRPKGLIELNGQPLVAHVLDHLSDLEVHDVIMVLGYAGDRVRDYFGSMYKNCRLTYVDNPNYACTDNLYSLWLAREHIVDEDMIFFNGDVFFEKEILRRILESRYSDSLVVDESIPLVDDAMKVHLRKGRLLAIGKKIDPQPNGWAMGIYRLSPEGTQRYFSIASELFANGPENISFVVPFERVARERPVYSIPTSEELWLEIDTLDDYVAACLRLKDAASLMRMLVTVGLKAVMPSTFLPPILHNLTDYLGNRRLFVVGAGKAAATMAHALEATWGPDRITAGLVISNDSRSKLTKIEHFIGTHPLPSPPNLEATRRMLALKKRYDIGSDDLVVALISGGGSALLELPVEGISLEDLQAITHQLLMHGANETELAVVRKQLSRVKGGRLARHFAPAPILSLVLSDVSTNDFSTIASGPFSPDSGTPADALMILEKYGLHEKAPHSVVAHLEKNLSLSVSPGHFSHVDQRIVAEPSTMIQAVRGHAKRYGFDVIIASNLHGEAREAAHHWCRMLHALSPSRPTVVVAGGYTSVHVGDACGTGGRNQEFAVACLEFLRHEPLTGVWTLASVATDGVDFTESSAGGILDSSTVKKSRDLSDSDLQKALDSHDTYPLLKTLGAHVMLGGPSGTNVCDIIMAILIP